MRTATVGFDEIESKGKIKGFCQIHSWFFEKKKFTLEYITKLILKVGKPLKCKLIRHR